jgi:hypothetical protein
MCIDCGKPIGRKNKRCMSCHSKIPKTAEHRKKLSDALVGKKMPWVSEANHKKKGVKLPERTPEHMDKIHAANLKRGRYNPLGDTYIDSRGYVCVKTTHYQKYNYRHLHRVVIEKHIGRPLTRGEIVHHIDGNKNNNDISNLALLTSAQHNVINHVIAKLNIDPNKDFATILIKTLRERYPELL